jgi:hypothetical protein
MLTRPIVILSSWSSGSPLVSGFLGECGAFLCPPFAKSTQPNRPSTYESEMFRGMVSATVNEYTFEYKVDPAIFRNGFKSWFTQQVSAATAINAKPIVLNHPLSVFLIDEICQIVDPRFLVVTRPFKKIEQSRIKQSLASSYGEEGAKVIYERAYSFLHETEKNYLAMSFRNFAASRESRLQLIDYCELDLSTEKIESSFRAVFPTVT